MVTRIALVFALVLAACGGPSPLSGPPLPRLWTLGPAAVDLKGPRLEIVIGADGVIRVGEQQFDLKALCERLCTFAEIRRDLDHPSSPGEGFLVIRCHRDLPWSAIHRVLLAAGEPNVRLYRILFAVEPVGGGKEGTFALYLTRTFGSHGNYRMPDGRGHVVAIPTRNVEPVEPVSLTPALARLGSPLSDASFELNAWPDVPVEYVLRTADLLVQGGVREIAVGPPPPELWWDAPQGVTTPALAPGLRLDGVDVGPDPESAAVAPRSTRSAEIAGATVSPRKSNPWYFGVPIPNMPKGDRGVIIGRYLGLLAAAQERDGSWGDGDVGLTALILLAYLENGATPERLQWRETVKKGLDFLLRVQGADGSFPKTTGDHALATAALISAAQGSPESTCLSREDLALAIAVIDGSLTGEKLNRERELRQHFEVRIGSRGLEGMALAAIILGAEPR